MGKSNKKRHKVRDRSAGQERDRSPVNDALTVSESSDSDLEERRKRTLPTSNMQHTENDSDKYKLYKVPGYSRKYPDNSNKSDYIVFISRVEENRPFSDKDRLALSKALRDHCVSGVMHLRPVNRYKVSITFDLSNNANVFIQNEKLLKALSLKASIPAGDTEVTGVLTSVPLELSNKNIFALIGSSRNVIQVRRFMRRVRGEGGEVSFQPTQTVAVTFASTQLPEYVYLDSWRHEVKIYIPPVKQCLKCLRYGHIAKFCRNDEVCSICTLKHNFKNCTADRTKPKCANCNGEHVAISSSCPIKKAKIEENKIKSHSVQYSDLFNEASFPHLASKSIETQINNLTKSDTFINLILETITNILTNKSKDNNTPINSASIRATLKQTLSKTSPLLK